MTKQGFLLHSGYVIRAYSFSVIISNMVTVILNDTTNDNFII